MQAGYSRGNREKITIAITNAEGVAFGPIPKLTSGAGRRGGVCLARGNCVGHAGASRASLRGPGQKASAFPTREDEGFISRDDRGGPCFRPRPEITMQEKSYCKHVGGRIRPGEVVLGGEGNGQA